MLRLTTQEVRKMNDIVRELKSIGYTLDRIRKNTDPVSIPNVEKKSTEDILKSLYRQIENMLDEKTGWGRNELKTMLSQEFSNYKILLDKNTHLIPVEEALDLKDDDMPF